MAAYRWDPTVAPGGELRRIGRAQVDRADAELDLEDHHVAVHQVRKRTKKLRALLRLVRPVAEDLYAAENHRLRDLARGLADLRDDAASVEALAGLIEDAGEALPDEVARRVREGLAAAAGEDADPDRVLARARHELVELRGRIELGWTLPDGVAGSAAVASGLRRSYARGREAFAEATEDPSTDALHDWRKRVKDHGYHCRLLRNLWRPVMEARVSELSHLGELLGDDHDLALLRAELTADPDRFGGEVATGTVTVLFDRRRAALQQEAINLGRRVYADRPKTLERRMVRWYEAAASEAEAATAEPLIRPGD